MFLYFLLIIYNLSLSAYFDFKNITIIEGHTRRSVCISDQNYKTDFLVHSKASIVV